jgi:hypothetical protein
MVEGVASAVSRSDDNFQGQEVGKGGGPSLRGWDGEAPFSPVPPVRDPSGPSFEEVWAWAKRDAERGRRTIADNGSLLWAYRGSKVEEWDGDWTNLTYPPVEYSGDHIQYYANLTNYLCQRFLDLTADGNTTLSPTMKAALIAQVLARPNGDSDANFEHYLRSYLAHGDAFATSNRSEFSEHNRKAISDVAAKMAEIEGKANLPNADMRAGNKILNEVVGLRGISDEERDALRRQNADRVRESVVGASLQQAFTLVSLMNRPV